MELVAGDGHGLAPEMDYGTALAAHVAVGLGTEMCAFYRLSFNAADARRAASFAAALGAPMVVPLTGFDRRALPRAAEAFAQANARLLLAHGGEPRAVEALRWLLEPLPYTEAVGLAWEVRPGVDDPARMADVLDAAGDALHYVRLHGGGPESTAQTGLGVGSLMTRLTLAGYAGPLVLTPSTASYRYVWAAWLGRAGGWGCGGKQSDASLVTLEART